MITNLINKLKQFEDGLTNGDTFKEVILQNEETIINMNVERQLYLQGVNALNVKIDSYMPYRQITIAIKHEKNQPVDRVTLRDTGAFHRDFKIAVSRENFYIYSNNDKAKDLKKKYGAIFGLIDENLLELIENIIHPFMLNKLKQTL